MQTKIKTIGLYLGILFSLPIIFTSCGSDDSTPNPPTPEGIKPPTADNFKAIQNNALNSMKQNHTITVDGMGMGGVIFTSTQGADVSISGGFKINGELVKDTILDVEFIELYSKSDLLISGVGTMGKHDDGTLGFLKTGGAFYIGVTKDGQPVDNDPLSISLMSVNIKVPTSLTGGMDQDMISWYGDFNDDGNFIWEPLPYSESVISEDFYNFFSGSIDWLNIDRFYNNPNPTTSLSVKVPEGYNKTNAKICVSFNGVPGLAMLYNYNPATQTFVELSDGFINVDAEVNVIFISEHQGNWVYSIKPITITEDSNIEFVTSDFSTATKEEVINLINALP